MHTSELVRLNVSAQKSVHNSTLTEANLAKVRDNNTKLQEGDIPFLAVFLAHISFMIVWAIVVYLISYTCKALQDAAQNASQDKDEIISIKHLQQHPCKTCQFFNKNHYLNCAVHPTDALTKQALNCSDYNPK